MLLDEGNREEALAAFYRALAIHESHVIGSLRKAATLSNIGLILFQTKKFLKSRKFFADAHVVLRNHVRNELGNEHPYIIFCMYYLCRLAIAQQRYEQALTNAAHLITFLPEFKWSYEMKGHAL